MARHRVESHADTTASADQAWAVVRDFCSPWHPAIATMQAEQAQGGGLIRRFTVTGDDTIYRERLTWFSDHDRTMAYTHISGIAGVDAYSARLTVSPTKTGATVRMQADLSAPSPRAAQIADGTQMIFDAGTQAIAQQALDAVPVVPAPACDRRVETSALRIETPPRLALTMAGQDSDTLCLFLHGIGGNQGNWDAQITEIASICKVAALDLRGYGDSALGSEQSTVDDYCADILRVMQTLGANKLVLCGLSYGAWIATSFAMRHPKTLAALVLSGGCTGMSEAGPHERTAFRSSREAPLNAGQTPADFAPAVVNMIAGPNATPDMRAALTASMEAIPTETYRDALRCFTNPMEKFDFSELSLPVLLMTGQHDRLAPPAEIKSVAERIWDTATTPDVRFEVIPDAGHVCNLERPDAYNAILAEFLKRLVP